MTININQTITDLQTYAESLDQNGHFAVIVHQNWFSPVLILPRSCVNLEDILSEEFTQCKIDFVGVNSYAYGKNIYSTTLESKAFCESESLNTESKAFCETKSLNINPPKTEEPKPEYKQITMEGVTFDLVPSEQ